WDNGGIHRCVEVNTFVWLNRRRLELRRFPPYAPELNPDEMVWTQMGKSPSVSDGIFESLLIAEIPPEHVGILSENPRILVEPRAAFPFL
ncbi:MAG: transposase, partial [Thermoplasmata archaeon]